MAVPCSFASSRVGWMPDAHQRRDAIDHINCAVCNLIVGLTHWYFLAVTSKREPWLVNVRNALTELTSRWIVSTRHPAGEGQQRRLSRITNLARFYNQNNRFYRKQLIIQETRTFLLPVVEDENGNVEKNWRGNRAMKVTKPWSRADRRSKTDGGKRMLKWKPVEDIPEDVDKAT